MTFRVVQYQKQSSDKILNFEKHVWENVQFYNNRT